MQMNNLSPSQIRSKFHETETSLGLTQSSYEAKFVYCQQQIPGPDSYLYQLFQPLKPHLADFTTDHIRIINGLAAKMIYHAGRALNVPISTTILAQSLIHFFYARKNYIEYDIRDAMIGAMYLACKSQETLRKSYQIVIVFDHIFKIFEGEKEPSKIVIDGSEYNYMKKNRLIDCQIDILFELGFQVYRLMDLPHRHLSSLLSFFQNHHRFKEIATKAYKILNDCYFTTVCLYYTPQIITAASVYIAMKQIKAQFPTVPWWTLMQAKLESIENIEIELQAFKKVQSQINLRNVQEIIEKNALKNEGTKNVFPIPYYRKIWLARNDKIRIKIISEPVFEEKIELVNQVLEKKIEIEEEQVNRKKSNQMLKEFREQQILSESSEQSRRHKKKSKKNKDKHKHDKHKRKQIKKKKHKGHKYNRSPSSRKSSEKDAYFDEKNKQMLEEQSEIKKHKRQEKIQAEEPKQKEKNKLMMESLNLSKTSLLSSINKQLQKHKQRIQKKEEDISERKQSKEKQEKSNKEESEQDEDMKLIMELKRKMKKNKEQKQKE